jgi:pyruvate carboxylase
MTSQPSIGALLSSLQGTEHDPKLDLSQVRALEGGVEQTKLSPVGIKGADLGQVQLGVVLGTLQRHDPKLDLSQVRALDTYWAQLRLLYSPFEAGLTGWAERSYRTDCR